MLLRILLVIGGVAYFCIWNCNQQSTSPEAESNLEMEVTGSGNLVEVIHYLHQDHAAHFAQVKILTHTTLLCSKLSIINNTARISNIWKLASKLDVWYSLLSLRCISYIVDVTNSKLYNKNPRLGFKFNSKTTVVTQFNITANVIANSAFSSARPLQSPAAFVQLAKDGNKLLQLIEKQYKEGFTEETRVRYANILIDLVNIYIINRASFFMGKLPLQTLNTWRALQMMFSPPPLWWPAHQSSSQ